MGTGGTVTREGLQVEFTKSPRGMVAAHKRGIRLGLMKASQFWRKEFLPGHFENVGRAKYGMRKNTRAYEVKKAKAKHHRRPLVWSGDTRNAAKYGAATYKGSTKNGMLIMKGLPWYVKRTMHGRLYEFDMTTLSRDEPVPLGRVIQEAVMQALALVKKGK